MANHPSVDSIVAAIWQFVRGDTNVVAFEHWVYANSDELDVRLGRQDALELLSADYRSMEAVARVKETLRAYAGRASLLACRCVTLGNLTVVDMGAEGGDVLASIEQRRSRGEPWWWLWCGECSRCGEWWLVAQEERQNDVFCLRRLDDTEVHRLVEKDVWPGDFDTYESLLRLGRDAGRVVRFADPHGAPSLRWTITDLARARPGIRASELASLLNLDSDVARALAQRAIRDDGVKIELDQE